MRVLGWWALALLAGGLCGCAPDPVGVPAAEFDETQRSPRLAAEVVEALTVVTDPARLVTVDGADVGGRAQIAAALDTLARSGDRRLAWVVVDLLRFEQGGELEPALLDALAALTGVAAGGPTGWVEVSNVLLSGDVPAPPDYLSWKSRIHVGQEPDWAPFFVAASDLDWRTVSWGGVARDGIPTLVAPAVVTDRAAWADGTLVYGLEVRGEARAYPRPVLERWEMVEDDLGGVALSLSYCSLCGAPIAYLTGTVPGAGGRLELRTSGLLQQSNKLMYDRGTESLFDQWSGHAVSGPLRGVSLETISGVTATWGEWRAAHPDSTIVSAATGPYPAASLESTRDVGGPVFPVGRIDDRLDAQVRVLGVLGPSGAVAFPLVAARDALVDGVTVEAGGVRLTLRAGGVEAVDAITGQPLAGTEGYWFVWSQRQPDALLWQR